MRINILYDHFVDFANKQVTIGGIQSYILSLVSICKKMGHGVDVFQIGEKERSISIDGLNVHEIQVRNKTDYQEFANAVASKTDHINDAYIFATDSIIPKNNPFRLSIGIQHGINWDMPRDKSRNPLIVQLLKVRRNLIITRKVNNVNMLVCVDYNFVNWLRAQSDRLDTQLLVIPNYTQIAPICEKPTDRINIIFARRFWWYRGTRVFTEAITNILTKYNNVFVTIAGSGPDEEWMHLKLDSFENVKFTSYSSSESMIIHSDKHIAVVPTVGSEGTSLSLLEAMSTQCAVVASDVGGMTNIILDGYNGLLIPAGNAEKLYEGISYMIEHEKERTFMAEKGYETVKYAFSYEKWERCWQMVINELISKS